MSEASLFPRYHLVVAGVVFVFWLIFLFSVLTGESRPSHLGPSHSTEAGIKTGMVAVSVVFLIVFLVASTVGIQLLEGGAGGPSTLGLVLTYALSLVAGLVGAVIAFFVFLTRA